MDSDISLQSDLISLKSPSLKKQTYLHMHCKFEQLYKDLNELKYEVELEQ